KSALQQFCFFLERELMSEYRKVRLSPRRSLMKYFCAFLTVLLFSATAFAGMPSSRNVFLIVEENHSYSSVIGNPSMPYLNSLAAKFGLATQYYANTHPSIGNYFMLTTGQIITNDDGFTGQINVDDIVDHLQTAAK